MTIQMKPLRQYFCMIPFFFFNILQNDLEIFLNFDAWHSLEIKAKDRLSYLIVYVHPYCTIYIGMPCCVMYEHAQ